jgi:hypothetical protein
VGGIMSDAYVIEVQARTAGIVVRDGRKFCFFAAHHDFNSLERCSFGSLAAAQKAAIRCANEGRNRRQQQTTGWCEHAPFCLEA